MVYGFVALAIISLIGVYVYKLRRRLKDEEIQFKNYEESLEKKRNMPSTKDMFCSLYCEEDMNRSFQTCPKCKKTWATDDEETRKYYCNTAWKMCKSCAMKDRECAACGKKI